MVNAVIWMMRDSRDLQVATIRRLKPAATGQREGRRGIQVATMRRLKPAATGMMERGRDFRVTIMQ